MSTLDKINSELAILEGELSQLRHYTNDIGEAKDAAKSVINMSLSFLKDFQSKVEEINKQMSAATLGFQGVVNKTSENFQQAEKQFAASIEDAKKSLSDIRNDLSKTAENVNTLTGKIESIDILGRFHQLGSIVSNLESHIEERFKMQAKRTETNLQSVMAAMKSVQKQNLIVFAISGVLSLGILILILVK